MTTQISSRDFNQDTSRAKRAAERGPVFITDRGRTAHVLLSIHDYEALVGAQADLTRLLADPAAAEVHFEPDPADLGLQPARFA